MYAVVNQSGAFVFSAGVPKRLVTSALCLTTDSITDAKERAESKCKCSRRGSEFTIVECVPVANLKSGPETWKVLDSDRAGDVFNENSRVAELERQLEAITEELKKFRALRRY
jgi:hypothetical protein